MRRREKKKISLRAIVIIIISIFFLMISIGYSYLSQNLNISAKSTIVPQQGGGGSNFEQGNGTYNWKITNSYGVGTEEDPLILELSISVVNMDGDISQWEIGFDIPETYNETRTNAWDASSRTYENGRLTLVAQPWNGAIPNGGSYTLSFQLALNEMIDFEVENLTLNGKLLSYEP